jgi:hypothetical protein
MTSTNTFIDHAELSSTQRASCRATSFTVRSPRLLKLQAGVRNADLAQLLKTHNALTAAVVTACNPASRKLPATQNKTRHAALAAAIKKLKLSSLPAERRTQDNGETFDAAYLVLNISGAQAEALLTEFDQHALLWCNQSSPPELMLHPMVRRRGAEALR